MSQVHPVGINLGSKPRSFQPQEVRGFATRLQHHVSLLDVCSLGLITVFSGQLIGWESALSVAGVGSVALAYALIAMLALAFIGCLAHIMKIMPLSGGLFIFTRVLVGFLPGYMLGCLQIALYALLTSITANRLVHAIFLGFFDIYESNYASIVFLIVYSLSISIYLLNGKILWGYSLMSCCFGLLFLLLFIFASFKYTNAQNYSINHSESYSSGYIDQDRSVRAQDEWFVGGISNFLHVFPRIAWMFMGLESMLYHASDSNINSNKEIEKSAINSSSKIFPQAMVIATAIVFVLSSLLLGIIPALPAPSNHHLNANPSVDSSFVLVYELAFHLQRRYVCCLVIPLHLASMVSLQGRSSKILSSIATANLLPEILTKPIFLSSPWCFMPIPAIILLNLMAMVLSVLSWHEPQLRPQLEQAVYLCFFLTILALSIAYWFMIRKYHETISKLYQRIGMIAACYCSFVAIIGMVAVLGFQGDDNAIVLVAIFALGVIFMLTSYFLYAKKRQKFTSEEMKLTFTSLVIKFNTRVRNRVKKGQNSPGNSSSKKNSLSALIQRGLSSACSPKVQSSVSRVLGFIHSHSRNASSKESKLSISSKSVSISAAASHGHVSISRRVSENRSTRRSTNEGLARVEIVTAHLLDSSPLIPVATLAQFKSSLRVQEYNDPDPAPVISAMEAVVTSPSASGSILKQPHRALSSKNLLSSPSRQPSFQTLRTQQSLRRTATGIMLSPSSHAADAASAVMNSNIDTNNQLNISQPGSMAASRNNSQASAMDVPAMAAIMSPARMNISIGLVKKPSAGSMARHKSSASTANNNIRYAIQTWAEEENNTPRLMDLTPPLPLLLGSETDPSSLSLALQLPGSISSKHPSTAMSMSIPVLREDTHIHSEASSVRSAYSIHSSYSFHSLACSPDTKKKVVMQLDDEDIET